MNALSSLTQTAAVTALRSHRPVFTALAACALFLGLATTSQAAPITGTQLPPGPYSTGWANGTGGFWNPPSTNALNYAKQAPGHVGEDTPYVLFNTNAVGSVTLDFYNLAPGLAFFEVRVDDSAPGSSSHPVATGDNIYSGNAVSSGTTELGVVYTATNYVDVRLALGAERDWDFDWVRFEVQPVPLPAAAWLFGSALLGLGLVKRRKA